MDLSDRSISFERPPFQKERLMKITAGSIRRYCERFEVYASYIKMGKLDGLFIVIVDICDHVEPLTT